MQRLAFTNLNDHFYSTNLVDNTIISKLLHRLTKGLYIDNRNIDDPIVTADYFETQQRGYLISHFNNLKILWNKFQSFEQILKFTLLI